MFDLEKSISAWRQQMLAAGLNPPELDELEGHLREEIERQMRSGRDAQRSFQEAAGVIGRAGPLGTEFKKVSHPLGSRAVKLLGLACGGLASFFTAWMFLVLWTIRETDWLERLAGSLAVVAIILAWRRGDRWLPALRQPWLPPMIGVLCCLASLGVMNLFVTRIAPHFLIQAAGASLPVGPMVVAFIWVWAGAAMLGFCASKFQAPIEKSPAHYV